MYYGEWRKAPVAIKQIKGNSIDHTTFEDFRKEIDISVKMKPHPNVLQIYGICAESVDKLCIVMEYCQAGSLDKYLFSDRKILDQMKLDWIEGIAAGMYHITKQKIVHRDLAARNILLTKDLNPKVGLGLGLTRVRLATLEWVDNWRLKRYTAHIWTGDHSDGVLLLIIINAV